MSVAHTKAAQDVIEVIEIVISLFQHGSVANGHIYLAIRVSNCAIPLRDREHTIKHTTIQ